MLRRRLVGALVAVLMVGAMVGAAAFAVRRPVVEPAPAATPPPTTAITTTAPTSTTTRPAATTTTTAPLPAARVGEPWGSTLGVTMFRGNPTRTYYGTGPFPPSAPAEVWRFPEEDPLCGRSTVAGETTLWCGTGWTGQPAIWERPDGVTELVFGAYDKAVHFLDAATGTPTRPPFPVGDIIKGSVTIDPDGHPLVYTGSRDDKLRIIALDRPEPTELWSLDAAAVPGIWNNDWDANPVIVDDVMYEGGENGWFFAILLNRTFDDDGLVAVDPEVLVQMPGWTDELIAEVGQNVSIESSVAVFDDRAYFTNSGGRVVGVDIARIHTGEAPIVFDFWAGDDIDASPVVDADGMLYIAVEAERGTARSEEVGQLLKLDPYAADDPLIWSVPVPPVGSGDGGIWATPALAFGYVYVPTHTGQLLVVDAATGAVTFEDEVGPHTWSSPVVIEDMLLVAPCESAELRAYSLARPDVPTPVWDLTPAAGGCIESTPVVWNGRIYVGSRDGFMRAYAAN